MLNLEAGTHSKRCAIYTRKSADPPVGQEITSIESQRAICEAYVASQAHKGWRPAAKFYADSGQSGAHLNRPALQELMSDVETGLVEIVVVYKLDRITRTLLDFVRLIDFFDRFGVAFVSITQNFDTSDSMGRLIRNVLLTFAQFEREIASDRIRDKKLVMKQRGLWIGGDPPLGFDVKRGRLVANPVEAPAVRCIFETYVATGSVSSVHKNLLLQGYRRKIWRSKTGVRKGGTPVSLSSLHHVLRNPAYIGELVAGGERFPETHAPLIERDLWDRAQRVLKDREQFKPRRPDHVLTGILFDAFGRRMHAREVRTGTAAGRYYASAFAAWAVRQKIRTIRVKADPAERLVVETLKRLLSDRLRIRPLLLTAGVNGVELDTLSSLGLPAAGRLDQLNDRQLSAALKLVVDRVEIGEECVRVVTRTDALAAYLRWDGVGMFMMSDLALSRATRTHIEEIPIAITRERRKSWLPLEPCPAPQKPCARLAALLSEAKVAQELVFAHREVAVPDLARSLGRKPASFSRLVRLNYLAPDIVAAIIDGTQPPTMSRRSLMECDLPMDWNLQRRLLGFPARQELWEIDKRSRPAVS